MSKKAIVIHSGGMDSSICLALAIKEFGVDQVESLSFDYNQRHHSAELKAAETICRHWGVAHTVITVDVLRQVTHNALMDPSIPIQSEGEAPNTLVLGRNGLMARLGAIYAHHKGASLIYMGVIEVESANSGYRDCSRAYMDLMEKILQMDLSNPKFEIRTPLSFLTKAETLKLADSLSIVDFLLEHTITCYEGIGGKGCEKCPACILRNEGIEEYFRSKEPAAAPRS